MGMAPHPHLHLHLHPRGGDMAPSPHVRSKGKLLQRHVPPHVRAREVFVLSRPPPPVRSHSHSHSAHSSPLLQPLILYHVARVAGARNLTTACRTSWAQNTAPPNSTSSNQTAAESSEPQSQEKTRFLKKHLDAIRNTIGESLDSADYDSKNNNDNNSPSTSSSSSDHDHHHHADHVVLLDDEDDFLSPSVHHDDEVGNTRMFRYENQATYSGKAVYNCIRLEPDGSTRPTTMRRRDLMRMTNIAPRDLRRIDPTLTLTRTSPCLTAREDVLLVNLGGVRLVVSEDHALLFEPTTGPSVRFLESITQRLAQLRRLERLPAYARGDLTVPVPFELEVVEAALIMGTARLDNKLLRVAERTDVLVRKITGPSGIANPITAEMLEELRRVKIQLVQLESRAEAIKAAILEVLDEDEDARELLVSKTVEDRKRKEAAAAAMIEALRNTPVDAPAGVVLSPNLEITVTAEEGEEETEQERLDRMEGETEMCEELLEYYLQRFETVHSESERLLDSMRDLEESISVSLASRRLAVNQLELRLSIATFAVAIGALVTGAFGMNLRSTLEMSVSWFYGTCCLIVLGCFLINRLLLSWTQKMKILS
ncbi:magnesium transporter MRS2 [Pycnococcus provasolii]